MLTELYLAGKYLRPRRNMVSIIALTSILGVLLGVMVLIVVMAVMTGFTDVMKAKLIETQAHFQIHSPRGWILDPERAVDAVKQRGGSAAPVIQGAVLVQYGQNKRSLDTQAVIFAASETELKKHLDTDSYIKKGQFKLGREGKTSYAVISTDMAERWQIGVGDTFLVHSARKLTDLVKFNANGKVELNQESSIYLPTEFTVSGIYSAGKSDFDRIIFFTDPDDASELFNLPWGAATSVFGWGDDPFDQEELLNELRYALPECMVISWEEANRKFLDVLNVEKMMMFFLLIFIVLVAAFSITNTLITSVYQKTREIGLLKALGCSDGAVMRIFVFQGLLVGVIGSLAGTLTGILVIHFRNDILR
ncbi:MAG: ABC transporter permease, partial [Lentisphaeria bacterium]|nr:ABC transporter permease [Lentisphaeria bacterium]